MASIIVRGKRLYLRHWDKAIEKNIDKALGLKNDREGMRKAKEIKKLFEANLLDKYHSINTIIKNRITIEEAAKLFSEVKKHSSGTKTVIDLAIKHLIAATEKKYITDLNRMDFRKFSIYLSSIYSRALRNLFGWLAAEKMVKENLVILEKGESKPIKIIPDVDFTEIKTYLWNHNKNGYYFVRMLELTGLRKSSAIVLTWEQVDFEQKNLCVKNVKKNRDFIFPLTDEIISLLKEIGIKETGKIFPYKSDNLAFWYRAQRELKIEPVYGLHQIRKTFISKMVDDGIQLSDVAKLADHRSVQTTQNYYVKTNVERLRLLLNKNSFSSLETSLEVEDKEAQILQLSK